MRKKILTVSVLLFALIILAGVGISYRKAGKEKRTEEIVKGETDTSGQEENDKLRTLPEIRDGVDAFLKKGKEGQFRNISFGGFTPVVTSEESVDKITLRLPRGEKTMEALDSAMEVLKTFFGDKLDRDYITNMNVGGEKLDEYEKEIREETSDPNMGMLLVFHKDEYHAQVDSSCSVLWIDTGIEGVTPSGDYLDKEYYAGAADGSLNDSYKSSSGEMTVGEAVQKTEDYFNKDFPLEPEKYVKYRVFDGYAVKQEDGTYGFDFGMRREYKGMPCESAWSGTSAYDGKDSFDIMEAYLDGNGKVSFFNGFSRNNLVEVTETYEKILPPETAMEYVAEKIGDATEYEVTAMELSYTLEDKVEGGIDEDRTEYGTPVWMIRAMNQSDGHETRFYVNVITGETKSRVM